MTSINTETATSSTPSDAVIDDLSIEDLEAMMSDEGLSEGAIEEGATDVASLEADEVEDGADIEIDEVDETNELSEEDLLSAMSDVETDEEIQKSYEEQGDEVEESESAPKMATEEDRKKVTKAPAEKKAPKKTVSTDKRSIVADDRASDGFFLLEKADLLLDEAGKQAKHDEVAEMIDGMNVKVGASCLNFLASLNGKAKMSLFTEITFKFVSAPDAEPIKAGDLQQHFMDGDANGVKSYAKGTAMPKTTNGLKMLSLLKVIIKKEGGYFINPESALFEVAKTVVGTK